MTTGRARWERLARDPYFAVINDPGNRGTSPGPSDEFFRSGEAHIEWMLREIAAHVDADFCPARALDFGCGVGRLTLPLAKRVDHVIGVDISARMLREAKRNCDAQGVENVDLIEYRDFVAGESRVAPTSIDFVHSYIVLQHVAPRVGLRIIDRLLTALRPGGVAALHVTYARRASGIRKAAHRLRRWVPGANVALNLVQRRPALEPHMPMYEYSLSRVYERLAARGCLAVHALLTDHGGHLGAVILVRAPGSRHSDRR